MWALCGLVLVGPVLRSALPAAVLSGAAPTTPTPFQAVRPVSPPRASLGKQPEVQPVMLRPTLQDGLRRRRNSGTWYVGKGKLIAKVNGMPKRMTIAKIRLDFQPPENLIEENVLYFVSRFRLREKTEPVLVYYDGTDYRLYDGFHRVAAAIRVGRRTIQVEIVRGTRADMDAEWRKGLEAIKKGNAEWAKTQAELKR